MSKGSFNIFDCSQTKMISGKQMNNEMKLSISSIPDCLQYQNGSSDNIIKEPSAPKSLFQCRYLVVLLDFFVFFEINLFRVTTSISVVAMVNNSAISSHKSSRNSSIDSCPYISDVEGHTDANTEGEFDWNPSIQGYILGAGFLGYVLTQIPGGLLAEAYGAKIVIMSGLLFSSLAHFLSPFAAWASEYWMLAAQFLRGVGQGLMPAAHSVLASNWFPRSERGLLNSLAMSGYAVGALVAGFSSGAMCASSFLGGWPSVYYVYGAFGLVMCLLYQILLYESPKVHPRIDSAERTYILQNQESDMSQKRPPTPWKAILTSVPFHILVFAIFAQFWSGAHFLSVHPLFLENILHFNIKETGLLTSIPFIFQSILTFVSSGICKWLYARNYVGVDKARKGCNLMCCLLYSVCLLGVYFAGCNKVLSSILAIAAFSSVGLAFTGCMIAPNDMSPTFAGTVVGLSSTIGTLASFIFPVIVGIMTNEAQTLEQWNKVFLMCIGLVMSSGILFCLFGSAEVQPWNFPSTEEIDKNCSKDNKMKKDYEEPENCIEAVIHL